MFCVVVMANVDLLSDSIKKIKERVKKKADLTLREKI